MSRCKEIGTIDSIQEISFDKKLIVSGRLDNGNQGWLQRVGGVFKKRGESIVFINEHDIPTMIDENTLINLKILALEESK